MALRIPASLASGQIIVLEGVTPEMAGQALKQQIKEGQKVDERTRRTTFVEVLVGDGQLLANHLSLLNAGISADTLVSVVFQLITVICSN